MTALPVFTPYQTFLFLTLVMLIRYFALAGTFYFICWRTSRPPISHKPRGADQNLQDIKWSVLSSFIFAGAGTLLISLWHGGHTRIYLNVTDYGWVYFMLSLPLYLFLHDTYFYWSHRLLHRGVLYRRIHKVHHHSTIPTAWTSFSFHPLEALLQALVLPLLVVLLPIHWTLLVLFLTLMTILGILNHLGYEFYPAVLERRFKFITASHHQFHHQQVKKNFGLYFTWWDHWMQTEGVRE
jgi:Delta7-sterol 5-desaturase